MMMPTKKMTTRAAALTLTIFAIVSAALSGGRDNNPMNAGETQSRDAWGLTLDGAMGNPALVGLDQPPRGGLSLLPLSVAVWSDKLALPLEPRVFLDPPRSTAYYLTMFLNESFNLGKNLSPEQVSNKLTTGLRDGADVYAGAKASPIVFATRGFGFSVGTFADAYAKIPGGLLLPIFSDAAGGLLAGNKLDISNMRLSSIWASEIAVKLGYSTKVPFIRDYLGLDSGAAGVGIKALLGHAYFNAEMEKGSAIFYDTESNKYKVINGRLKVLSAGTGLHGDYRYNYSYLTDNPINGPGWGLDFGTVFHNRNQALSVDIRDIGMILWNGREVRSGNISFKQTFKEDGYDLSNLPSDVDSLFDFTDTLKPSDKTYIFWLPANLNVGYSYTLQFGGDLNVLLGYVTASLGYNQRLAPGIGGDTYTPRFSVGATFGLLAGYLPVRYGMICGGPEKLASAVGLGLDAKNISIDLFYKAVGSPALQSKRGFEIGSGLTFRWGRSKNKVKDEPETTVSAPEAADTAQEPAMPVVSEFFPDEDEQADTVYEPIESITGTPPAEFVPTPEPIAELVPEPAPEPWPAMEPEPTEEETQTLGVNQRAINFMPGSADLTVNSYAPLKTIAAILARYPHIRYEVQGHTDSHGEEMYNLLLSAERAAVVKYCLMLLGAPETNLVSVGYGKNIPIADNNSAVGRALNRRVEFVPIYSKEHYDWVKRFELEMIPRLTNRVLYGRKMVEIIKARNNEIISPAPLPNSETPP